VVEVMRCV